MATVTVELPRALQGGDGTARGSPAVGSTVGEVLLALSKSRPGLGPVLFRPDGRLARAYAIFLNAKDIRNLDGESTTVRDGDVVAVVAALAGG